MLPLMMSASAGASGDDAGFGETDVPDSEMASAAISEYGRIVRMNSGIGVASGSVTFCATVK